MDMIAIQYNAKLQRLVKQVKADISKEIMPLVRQLVPEYTQDAVATTDAWSDLITNAMSFLFAKWSSERVSAGAQRIASEFVQASVKKSERDMKKSVGIDVFSGSKTMQDYLHASAQQNAQLIKSIPAKYLEEVQTLVMANMRSGMRPSFIEKALQEQFGVTQRRAKMIARDQTSKIQGELNRKQQQGAGFTHFRWLTSHDSRVRHDHDVFEHRVTKYGKGVYLWSDLPLEKGVPVSPGSPINCRCTAIPVSEREVKANQDKGLTNPSVSK
ncbi:phage minor head protein [Pseudomonas sp. CJQ_7]|uniref:phage head morphogenesis protein n=1 Tax=Pseudomonas sp. CJQ_7 TaxID=3367166 RepID=UPI00370B5126